MAPAQNTKPHPKKKGLKLPYPKKGQEVFFRIKSTTSYSKIHPALVTKDNEDGFEGGVHLDQTQWTFSNSKPLPRTLVDPIHYHLTVDQIAYVENMIKLVDIDVACRANDDPVTKEEITKIRGINGCSGGFQMHQGRTPATMSWSLA